MPTLVPCKSAAPQSGPSRTPPLSITDSTRFVEVSSCGVRESSGSSEFWTGRINVETADSTATSAYTNTALPSTSATTPARASAPVRARPSLKSSESTRARRISAPTNGAANAAGASRTMPASATPAVPPDRYAKTASVIV